MRAVDLIEAKRNGIELTSEQIHQLIAGYVQGITPDYQMAAWAMAVYFRGMTRKETAALTLAMAHSGDIVNLDGVKGIKVDKHSTGGVGDTTTLVLAPLVASANVPVAKMSGRGLGHTGGTIDKLESIPRFQPELSQSEFIHQVNTIGLAIISQTRNLAPADKLLYALRDVTATVESIPLIASSIMSKKIAAGADAIVLDVKTGAGAFMKSFEQSLQLSKAMVEIGAEMGRETVAVISSMDQPLSNAIGNALEVKEAISLLRGDSLHSPELKELCLELGAQMLVLGQKSSSLSDGRKILLDKLDSGEALAKFKQLIIAQGGNPNIIDDCSLLPTASHIVPVPSQATGYVNDVLADKLGVAAAYLGAGRTTKDSSIDLSTGVRTLKRIGDFVERGEPLVELHLNESTSPQLLTEAIHCVEGAYGIAAEVNDINSASLIRAIVTVQGVTYHH
jgi:pyrimidine-nucleoside phosphorylase